MQLVELEALPRDVSRAVYTQRILEIVGNIRKQKEEIGKVGGGVLNLGVGGCEEGGYGALCPKNKGFGGPGGSQGGDLGVSVGLVGWVWGLWCHLGVGDGVWRGCVPQK